MSAMPPDRWLLAGRDESPGERSLALELGIRLLFRTILLFAVYLLFHGHDGAGGGFPAGLVAGIGFALRYVAGGANELRAAVPFDPGLALGTGLLVALGTAAGAWFFGAPFGTSAVLEWQLPLVGTVKLVSSLGIDIGVFLLVVGVVLEMLRLLGVQASPESDVPEGQDSL